MSQQHTDRWMHTMDFIAKEKKFLKALAYAAPA